MNVYTCKDHDGHFPVGVASIVVADSEDEAREILDAELKANGLKPFARCPYTLVSLSTSSPKAIVLNNGDY
jgi:hypothetical protein